MNAQKYIVENNLEVNAGCSLRGMHDNIYFQELENPIYTLSNQSRKEKVKLGLWTYEGTRFTQKP